MSLRQDIWTGIDSTPDSHFKIHAAGEVVDLVSSWFTPDYMAFSAIQLGCDMPRLVIGVAHLGWDALEEAFRRE